ncbi:MAG: hypothetical protein ACRDSF_00140 [Pseudonocardiaceae bacterium]
MAWHEPFLLGPLGYMREIPSPSHSSGVDSNIIRSGGEFETASGNMSIDTFGHKKEWKFTWPWIDSRQADELMAFFRTARRRGLRMLDPFVLNLLSADVSMGGGESRTARLFQPAVGTVACFDVSPTLPSYLVPFIDTMIQWVVPTSTTGVVLADSGILQRTPLRDARPLKFNLQVTGQGTVQALVRPFDLAGSALSDVLGTAVVLDSTWKTVSVSYSPAITHISTAVGLSIATAVGIRTLGFTALKFGEQSDQWQIGEMTGPVLLRSIMRKLRPHHMFEVQAVIREK